MGALHPPGPVAGNLTYYLNFGPPVVRRRRAGYFHSADPPGG
jgi:hypothetical protein